MIITVALFLCFSFVLFTLPFLPAWREWLYSTDYKALPISPDYTNNIDYFSDGFREEVIDKLSRESATEFQDFNHISPTSAITDSLDNKKPLISFIDINTENPIRWTQPLFVNADLTCGNESVLAAVYAKGDLTLGADSQIHRWGHAEGAFHLGQNSAGLRRISSNVLLELEAGCWFERLQAPIVKFGSYAHSHFSTVIKQTEGDFASLPGVVQKTDSLFWIKGDCTLPAHHVYNGSLIVTGKLIIGEGTRITGNLKARQDILIEARACVGAVICESDIHFFEGVHADGPIISESNILVGANSTIGKPDALTTITGDNVVVESGVTVYGSVWAKNVGMVRPL